MNLIDVSDLNDYILSYLDYADIGRLYMLSKENKKLVTNFIRKKDTFKSLILLVSLFVNGVLFYLGKYLK